MIYKKLQERGMQMATKLAHTGPPKEEEFLQLLEKLSEREQYVMCMLPVITTLRFNVPDIMFEAFKDEEASMAHAEQFFKSKGVH